MQLNQMPKEEKVGEEKEGEKKKKEKKKKKKSGEKIQFHNVAINARESIRRFSGAAKFPPSRVAVAIPTSGRASAGQFPAGGTRGAWTQSGARRLSHRGCA